MNTTTLTIGRVLKDIALALSKKGFTTLSFRPSITEELPTWQPSQYGFTFGSLPEQCELTILEHEAEVLSALPDAPPDVFENKAEIGCIYVNGEPYTVSITTIPRVLFDANTLTTKSLFILDLTSCSGKDDIGVIFSDISSLMEDIESHIATDDMNRDDHIVSRESEIEMFVPPRHSSDIERRRAERAFYDDPRNRGDRQRRPSPPPAHIPPIDDTDVPHEPSSTEHVSPYEQGESQ